MAVALRPALCALALAWSASGAAAMGSADPFKPPPLSLLPAAEAASAPAEQTASDADRPKGLQGIRRGRRHSALIDGDWVEVGQQARGARLTSVTADGAHLLHPDGKREFLALSPDARLTPHQSGPKEGPP